MADSSNVGTMVTVIGTAIGTVIAMLSFWTKFIIDRIAKARRVGEKAQVAADKAQGVAEGALQEAVEAKIESHNVRELVDAMTRDIHDRIEGVGREVGESNAALRRKVTEVELFMRDHFVRSPEFNAAINEIKASQLRSEAQLDRLIEKMIP